MVSSHKFLGQVPLFKGSFKHNSTHILFLLGVMNIGRFLLEEKGFLGQSMGLEYPLDAASINNTFSKRGKNNFFCIFDFSFSAFSGDSFLFPFCPCITMPLQPQFQYKIKQKMFFMLNFVY